MPKAVVNENIELRQRLEEMTESGAEPSKHRDLLEAISIEFPNTIQPLQSSHSEARYTCGMYVFEFSGDEDYINIAGRNCPDIYAGHAFFEWLLTNHLLQEVDEADVRDDDLIMYFENGQWKHVGFWKLNGRVESKWGVGLLYNHERWEVPKNYGNEVRFFRSISPEAAIEHFLQYAQSRGVPVEWRS
jgi:hypothetical protein